MSVNLYMDVHIPAAITAGLRLRGVNVLTAQEDGRRRLPDDQLLDRATALDIIFDYDDTHGTATLCYGWLKSERAAIVAA